MKKKACFLLCLGIILSLITFWIAYFQTPKAIGTVCGAEWEYLTIDGNWYERVSEPPVHRRDKNRLLGTAISGENTIYLYSIKDHPEYLYARWDQDGWLYQFIQ